MNKTKTLKKEKKTMMMALRVEPSLMKAVKTIADQHGKAYQSMIREWIKEKIKNPTIF
jgi:predicted DNA binding CopG/RHH family protein